jgi:hypothetical protein
MAETTPKPATVPTLPQDQRSAARPAVAQNVTETDSVTTYHTTATPAQEQRQIVRLQRYTAFAAAAVSWSGNPRLADETARVLVQLAQAYESESA